MNKESVPCPEMYVVQRSGVTYNIRPEHTTQFMGTNNAGFSWDPAIQPGEVPRQPTYKFK